MLKEQHCPNNSCAQFTFNLKIFRVFGKSLQGFLTKVAVIKIRVLGRLAAENMRCCYSSSHKARSYVKTSWHKKLQHPSTHPLNTLQQSVIKFSSVCVIFARRLGIYRVTNGGKFVNIDRQASLTNSHYFVSM